MRNCAVTSSTSAFYGRVKRWQIRNHTTRDDVHGAMALVDLSQVDPPPDPDKYASLHTAKARLCKTSSLDKARAAALDTIPAWMDRDVTASAMSKRKKRSINQTTQDNWDDKALSAYYAERHKNAWKGGTKYYNEVLEDPKLCGKKGYGSRSIVENINQYVLDSPNDRKIRPTAFEKAVKEGRFGVSPIIRGRPKKIPDQLGISMATHSTVMQISAEGEACRPKLMATLHALVAGNKWENAFSLEYVYRVIRTSHPEVMNPQMAKNHEDRRVDWLSYRNILQWNEEAKKYLIAIGMAKDEPGFIRTFYAML